MASTYSDLKIELMATGENSGTWGTKTNTNLGTAIEEAITGSANVAFSSADVTLSLVDTNESQTARNLRLNLTGTSGGARNLTVPAIEKVYIINNGLADTVTVKNATGTGIAVPAGKTMYVYNDGTNVVDAITHLTSLTTGTLTTTSTTTLNGTTIPASSTLVTTTGTQTLSNKTLTSPTVNTPTISGGTINNTPIGGTTASTGAFTTVAASSTVTATKLVPTGNVTAGNGMYLPAANVLAFSTNGSERVRVTSGGNVGIGTTSPGVRLDVSGAAKFTQATYCPVEVVSDSVQAQFAASGSGNAVEVRALSNHPMVFRTNNIERMRITSGGNVGIGSNNPQARLHVANSQGGAEGRIFFDANVSSGYTTRIEATDVGLEFTAQSNFNGFAFKTGATPTEKVRITSAGNVGVGTTSPGVRLDVSGSAKVTQATYCPVEVVSDSVQAQFAASGSGNAVEVRALSNHPMVFRTNNIERMRIDSSGNVLVGTTSSGITGSRSGVSSSSKFAVEGSSFRVQIGNVGNEIAFSRNGINYISATEASASILVSCGTTGGVQLTAGSTSWSAVSDERLKTDLVEIKDAANKISTLRTVTGRYKTDNKSVSRAFLIAQDVQAVLPEAVTVTENAEKEEDNGQLMLSYTETIPLLVAAIKELKAEVDSLKSQLEGN